MIIPVASIVVPTVLIQIVVLTLAVFGLHHVSAKRNREEAVEAEQECQYGRARYVLAVALQDAGALTVYAEAGKAKIVNLLYRHYVRYLNPTHHENVIPDREVLLQKVTTIVQEHGLPYSVIDVLRSATQLHMEECLRHHKTRSMFDQYLDDP